MPRIGVIVGAIGARIHAPLIWWRVKLPAGFRSLLGKIWPWSFGACLVSWLSMLLGISTLDYFFEVYSPNLVYVLLLCMFASLFLTIITGFARDAHTEGRTAI